MDRRLNRHRSCGALFMGVFAAGAMALPASGQLTPTAHYGIESYAQVGSASFTDVNHSWFTLGNNQSGSLHMNQKGMWTVGPFGGSVTGNVFVSTNCEFSVGAIPVVVTGMAFGWDAKWVNGGGNPFSTVTSPKISLTIYELTTNVPVIRLEHLLGVLQGNVFGIFNGHIAAIPNYILAANTDYRLELRVKTLIDHTAFVGAPVATVTNEFGPGQGFDGFNGGMAFQAIPAPGTVALLALSGLLGRRRRAE